MISFERFLSSARRTLEGRARGHGYARLAESTDHDLYGTAAAVGILIGLGERPEGELAATLRSGILDFRQADGTFADPTHGVHHRAATALTTLRAVGGGSPEPSAVAPLLRAESVRPFLDQLDWSDPWLTSHDAAGVLAIGLSTDAVDPRTRHLWLDTYLDWLAENVDPSTGLWRVGAMGDLDDFPGLFGNLACSFHLHFLLTHLRRPWPYPARVVETGLALYRDTDAVVEKEETDWGFRQLDWVYSVARAARGGHRHAEVIECVVDLAERAAAAFGDPDAAAGDLHVLQARVCLVAELSRHLPDRLDVGERSLVTIVDERPFI